MTFVAEVNGHDTNGRKRAGGAAAATQQLVAQHAQRSLERVRALELGPVLPIRGVTGRVSRLYAVRFALTRFGVRTRYVGRKVEGAAFRVPVCQCDAFARQCSSFCSSLPGPRRVGLHCGPRTTHDASDSGTLWTGTVQMVSHKESGLFTWLHVASSGMWLRVASSTCAGGMRWDSCGGKRCSMSPLAPWVCT